MDKKAILFNGPPECGKDTAATFAKFYTEMKNEQGKIIPYRPQILAFADPIKSSIQNLYQLPYSCAYYEKERGHDWKTKPQLELCEKTGREVYIHIGEGQKSLHGSDFFGRIAARRIHNEKRDNLFIFSDLGFREEAIAIIRQVGAANTLIIELERNGCSYNSDSRSYVGDDLNQAYSNSLNIIRLPNHGDKNLLRLLIQGTLSKWLRISDGSSS